MSICTYSVLLILYSADVRAESSLNTSPSPSPAVGRQFRTHRTNTTQ